MKVCAKCKKTKEDINFASKRVEGKNWTQAYCRDCQKIYRREHYILNRQKYISKAKNWKNKIKIEVDELKNKPCIDCGVKYPPYVMQFDHIGNDKLFGISSKRGQLSREAIMKEIDKCELVCSNCHAARTWNRNLASFA